jgi:hypothetical protein
MTTWQIPEPLAVGWPMRTPESAKVTAGVLDDGRFRQTVEHAPPPGVTPAMCLWYLERLDRTLTWHNHAALASRILRHRMAFLHRWRQHNVEEAGNLPYFLPDLYRGRLK